MVAIKILRQVARPFKLLLRSANEREKKKKYLEACPEQERRQFSPFVVSNSTDGLILGKEAIIGFCLRNLRPLARSEVGEAQL